MTKKLLDFTGVIENTKMHAPLRLLLSAFQLTHCSLLNLTERKHLTWCGCSSKVCHKLLGIAVSAAQTSAKELQAALQSPESGKAPGIDGVPADYCKAFRTVRRRIYCWI